MVKNGEKTVFFQCTIEINLMSEIWYNNGTTMVQQMVFFAVF
jgi:hypothetical protein